MTNKRRKPCHASALGHTEVARLLNAAMRLTGDAELTAHNIHDWMEGGDTYDKADATVRAYMGDEMYDAIELTARLVGVLHARLQGYDTCTVGGMKFCNLQAGLK